MSIPAGLDTLPELILEITETYAPSRGISPRTKENLPEELYRILDYFRFRRLTRPVFDLHDLMDIESAPRNALEVMLREYDLPVWDGATDAQMRQVIRDILTVVGLRNTIVGWEKFLNDMSPNGVTVTIVKTRNATGRLFRFSRRFHGFPNQAIIDSAGETNDTVPYFWEPVLFEIDYTVTVTGTGLTAAYKEFLESTVRYFVPMHLDFFVTITFVYV